MLLDNRLVFVFFAFVSTISFCQYSEMSGQIFHAPNPFLEVTISKQGEADIADTIPLTKEGKFHYSYSNNSIAKLTCFTGTDVFYVVQKPNEKISLNVNNSLFDETLIFEGESSMKNLLLNRMSLLQEEANIYISENTFNTDTLTVFIEYKRIMNQMKDLETFLIEKYPDLAFALQKPNEIDAFCEMILNDRRAIFERNQSARSLYLNQLPEIKLLDSNKKEISIRDFKGKVTVIDFWANWCTVCIENFPQLKELEQKYSAKVNFVSIGTYFDFDSWKSCSMNYSFEHEYYFEHTNREMINTLGISFLPRYIILDENQKVLQSIAPFPNSGLLEEYLVKILETK